MSVKLPCETLHVLIEYSNKIDISLARLITRCARFVMNRYTCYHMPVGLYNMVIEYGVGTYRFRSTLCSAFDIVSFPSGRTSALGLELGTQIWFVNWITGEIVPLSISYQHQPLVSTWNSWNSSWNSCHAWNFWYFLILLDALETRLTTLETLETPRAGSWNAHRWNEAPRAKWLIEVTSTMTLETPKLRNTTGNYPYDRLPDPAGGFQLVTVFLEEQLT